MLRLSARAERAIAEDSMEQVEVARRGQDWAEACRTVALLAGAFERAMPDRLKNLRAMALCVRVSAVMMPPPSLSPWRFRLSSIRRLAGAGAMLHHVLVTPVERMLLPLWLVSFAFRLALCCLHPASGAAHSDLPA